MSTPTVEQQLDALWNAAKSQEYWLAANDQPLDWHRLTLLRNKNGQVADEVVARFEAATREECIAQLITYMAAKRLS